MIPFKMVNCTSCDWFRMLLDKNGSECGFACAQGNDIFDVNDVWPLSELLCHSDYALWEQEQEAGCHD